MYLFASGYKAETGNIINVAIRAYFGSCVRTKRPPHKFKNNNLAAYFTETSPEAKGLILHL